LNANGKAAKGMKRRRSFVGWIVIVLVSGLILFIWNEAKRQNIDPNLGLLDTIKAVGEGIVHRMGQG
jgi:hypothetical protein